MEINKKKELSIMRNYIVTDFAKWKSINEAESPGRTKQTAGMGQRVVGIPIDASSFKIKIVRDLDVLDANGKLTANGFASIINWIKQQPKWLPYYPALGDLAKNILVYSVSKDNERKQVIVFAIQPKPQGVPAEVQFVHKDEVGTLVSDPSKASLLAKSAADAQNKPEAKDSGATGGAAGGAAGAVKVPTPLTFDQLKMLSSGQPLFSAIDNAYLSMVKMPEFSNLQLMPKLKGELKAGKLGDAAVSLVKGIVAGFKLVDKYGDPVDNVNQQVADKLALFSAKATPQNSSKSYFLGLGARSIFEQTTVLGNDPAKGTGGAAGGDAGGSSTGTLPAGFDLAAFTAAIGGSSTESLGDIKLPEGGFKKGSVAKGDAEFKKFQQLVIDKFAKKLAGNALYKKFAGFGADGDYGQTTEKMVAALKGALGTSEKDGKVVTSELITKINTNKIDEAVYLGLNSRLVEQFDMGAFEETAKTYTPAGGGGKKKEKEKSEEKDEEKDQKKMTPLQAIDAKFVKVTREVSNYVATKDNFSAFSSTFDDDEQKAWDDLLRGKFSKWADQIKKDIVPAVEKIKTSNPDEYANYEKTLDELGRLLKGEKHYFIGTPVKLKTWTYKDKMLNPNALKLNKYYEFYLYLSSGVKKIAILADVMPG
jgi:hypothetical protein